MKRRKPPTAEEPLAKRQKANESENRSPTYWYRTGDIIIITQGKTAFKIHSDVLGRKSKVFNDLLNHDAPRPANEDTMDGCPIMHVTDRPSDFEIFLKLIYDGFQYREDQKDPEWVVIRVMLLLGDKYDVDEFRTEGIARLKLRFPTDISAWDKSEGIVVSQSELNQSIANITGKLNLPDLHAAVLYCCCLNSVRMLMYGRPKEDLPPLSEGDLIRCFEVKMDMPTLWCNIHVNLVRVAPTPETPCLALTRCRVDLRNMHIKAIESARMHMVSAYRMMHGDVWNPLITEIGDGLCKSCHDFYKTRLLQLRQEFRDSLKKRFKL